MQCKRVGGVDLHCDMLECRYHLTESRSGKVTDRPSDLPTCALAVADDGPQTPARIATLLGCSHQWVDHLCHSALRKMRIRLGDVGIDTAEDWVDMDREQAVGVEPLERGTQAEIVRGLKAKPALDTSWYGRRKASSAANKRRRLAGGEAA